MLGEFFADVVMEDLAGLEPRDRHIRERRDASPHKSRERVDAFEIKLRGAVIAVTVGAQVARLGIVDLCSLEVVAAKRDQPVARRRGEVALYGRDARLFGKNPP